ncbi:MAG TPA: ABC transporter ATP-binding protein [Thermoanaerobaculia bacterium]|nr:ABC transporter ATP-binding protein [Thermoanaerobaculia bacterium]
MRRAIEVEGVRKLYRRVTAGYQLRTLKSALLGRGLTAGLRPEETIVALDDVTFAVERGEAFGVVGGNGSGKSTLLKLVAGLLRPTAGRVAVGGRVAALIELGAGFHPEISGRENVFINGAVLGLSRREVERCYDEIVEFSGLGEFIEEPVKNYSSGMYVRLGFAVAIHTDPDILLVDEVLAVGDEAFAHRCVHRIESLLARGRTVLFVSHGLDLVEQLCDRVLWLDRGRNRGVGEPREVIDAYRQQVAEEEGRQHRRDKEADASGAEEAEAAGRPRRWGSRQAEITDARLLVDGVERYDLSTGADVAFVLEVRAREPLDDFVFGVAVSTPRGVECWGSNTELAGLRSRRLEGEARVRVRCPRLRLAPGEYHVDVAVHARDGAPYDYRRRAFRFTVSSAERGIGVYFPEHTWGFEGGVEWERASHGAATRTEPAEE